MAMTQVQPTEENIGAIQQQALNDLIDQHLQAAELAKFEQLKIGDDEVDQEIADMARQAGTTPANYVNFLEQGGIRPQPFREQLRTGRRPLPRPRPRRQEPGRSDHAPDDRVGDQASVSDR